MSDAYLVGATVVLVGAGLYFRSQQQMSSSKQAVMAASIGIDPKQVHEAMGPALSGRDAFQFNGYSTRTAMDERNTQRPAVSAVPRNASADAIVSQVQKVAGAVNADVKRKTAFVYAQRRSTPLHQGKIRDRFQVTNFVRQI